MSLICRYNLFLIIYLNRLCNLPYNDINEHKNYVIYIIINKQCLYNNENKEDNNNNNILRNDTIKKVTGDTITNINAHDRLSLISRLNERDNKSIISNTSLNLDNIIEDKINEYTDNVTKEILDNRLIDIQNNKEKIIELKLKAEYIKKYYQKRIK